MEHALAATSGLRAWIDGNDRVCRVLWGISPDLAQRYERNAIDLRVWVDFLIYENELVLTPDAAADLSVVSSKSPVRQDRLARCIAQADQLIGRARLLDLFHGRT